MSKNKEKQQPTPEDIERGYTLENVVIRSGKPPKRIGDVDVEQFLSLQAAVDHFESEEQKGEGVALKLINRQYKTDTVNRERTALTSEAKSGMAKIKKAARQNPEAKKRLESVLADLGLTGEVQI